MSVTTTTTRITGKHLQSKYSKAELASIIWNNLDKIDLFKEAVPTEWAYEQACRAIEKHRQDATALAALATDCLDAIWAENNFFTDQQQALFDAVEKYNGSL